MQRFAVVAFAAVVATLAVDIPQSASAAPIQNDHIQSSQAAPEPLYWIKNRQTGRCLEGAAGGHVYTAPCSGSTYQGWYYTPVGQGWHRIQNWQLNWCLDGNNGRVYGLACNGGGYQRWGRHSVTANIAHYATDYLDGNYEGSVYLSPINDGNYQKWDLIPYF
jgi:hypothetical protein